MGFNLIVEANVPYMKGLFEPVANVKYPESEAITPELMHDADALVTRTRTRCDASLLDGSRCRFIATATIGLDHIDSAYCRDHGIYVTNAPGCNAPAVAQYVMAVILKEYPDPSGKTLGVVGVGHVGSVVARWAEGLGMKVLLNDPPRAEAEGGEGFVDLDQIAKEADIISFHTPLTKPGTVHPSWHLCGEEFLAKVERHPIIINAARGPVADTEALIRAYDNGLVSRLVIDCWEGEPAIDRRLLERAWIATPHIAGYSRQGKERATARCVDALCEQFSLTPPTLPFVRPLDPPESVTASEVLETYDPMADTAALKERPEEFENMRNHYDLRMEPGQDAHR